MGCASSADTGTQYASLGHHGQQTVQTKQRTTNTQQQQQQQLPPSYTSQSQQDDKPPPYQQNVQEPVVAAVPKREKSENGPVAVQSKDVKSSVDFYSTDNMTGPCLPDFNCNEYTPTDVGTLELFKDYRVNGNEFPVQERPEVGDDHYTDYDFGVEKAFPTRYPDLEWLRTTDIREEPVLFADQTTRFDVGQGEVGTCWFLAMIANIADKPRLLRRVIPESTYENGMFHCRFWRFGVWIDVYTDDYLPVKFGDCIVSASSATDRNEMWVSLLEKAFAKLYGSYDDIEGGLTMDSYLNLTGGVAEVVRFKKVNVLPEKLFARLHNAFQCPMTMVGTAVEKEFDKHQGLVGGHAYSMSGVLMVDDNMLVRIRNPWGKGEWTGAWSDESEEWNSVSSERPPKDDDGEFFMDINDFMKYFDDCTICSMTPDVDRDGTADTLDYVTNMYGNWVEGKNGGFENRFENPKYCFTLDSSAMDENGDVPLVIQMIQRTYDRSDDLVHIRCFLYKVLFEKDNLLTLEIMGDKSNTFRDNMQDTYRFILEPGTYMVLPTTGQPDENDKEFLLRLFTAGPISDLNEVGDDKVIMSGRGRNGDEPYSKDTYRSTNTCIGSFRTNFNAGGQRAYEGFYTNPQFHLTSNVAQFIRVEMMQPAPGNAAPLGIKLLRTGESDPFPLSKEWIDQYFDSNIVYGEDSEDGRFQLGPSTDICYSIEPGTYTLIVHLDNELDQTDFAVVIYSQDDIGFQPENV